MKNFKVANHVKYENKDRQKNRNKVHHSSVRACVKISNRQLGASEESVVNKAFKIAITIKRIPNIETTSTVEEVALTIPNTQADELRFKVRLALSHINKTSQRKKG